MPSPHWIVGPRRVAAYAEALRLSPELGGATVHANVGLALQREGKITRAISHLRRAVELDPEDADLWQHLADAYADDEDPAAAIPCCERVVTLRPDDPQGHAELGSALLEEGRMEEAADCLRRALELGPDHVGALMKQGGLHEELGEMPEAEASYRRAHAVEPMAPAPLSCLATLLRGRLPDEDREAVRATAR